MCFVCVVQTPADCVLHYYLSKKREKYKHMVRKANLKRKKPLLKPSEFSNPPLTPTAIPPLPLSLFTSTKPKMEDGLSADEENNETLPSGEPSHLAPLGIFGTSCLA